MIYEIRAFTDSDIAQLTDLEARCIAADDGRLKLEYGSLRHRSTEHVNAIAIREGEDMVAFLGIYGRLPIPEIAGMVAPSHRRRGVGSTLFEAALPLLRMRGAQRSLLVVPAGSATGEAFARTHDAHPEHSEHALLLTRTVVKFPQQYQLSYRTALADDAAGVGSLLRDAFDWVANEASAKTRNPARVNAAFNRAASSGESSRKGSDLLSVAVSALNAELTRAPSRHLSSSDPTTAEYPKQRNRRQLRMLNQTVRCPERWSMTDPTRSFATSGSLPSMIQLRRSEATHVGLGVRTTGMF